MNGKGDTPRPVDAKRYAENYDAINWHREQARPVETIRTSRTEPDQGVERDTP